MTVKAVKIVTTVAVIVVALTGLLFATLREDTQYYKHVDEVMGSPDAWYGKRLQVHGHASSIRRRPDSLDYRFEIAHNGQVVTANYTGIVPDTFKDDPANPVEVVVDGDYRSDGTFDANTLLAKCPSKYEKALDDKAAEGSSE